MDGAGIAAALDVGAIAAQMGTAFIACPESSADAYHREALFGPGRRAHDYDKRYLRQARTLPAEPLHGVARGCSARLDGARLPHRLRCRQSLARCCESAGRGRFWRAMGRTGRRAGARYAGRGVGEGSSRRARGGREGRQFFFEKKNQKTFSRKDVAPQQGVLHDAKVFASFFKKKRFPASCRFASRRPETGIVHDAEYDYIVVGAGSAGCVRRQPALRRSCQPRSPARSRRERQLDLVSHPVRLPVRTRQSQSRLDVRNGA